MCTTNVTILYVVAVFFASDLLATNDATFLCAQVDIPASHSLPSPQHSGSEHIVPSIPGQDQFIIIIIIIIFS